METQDEMQRYDDAIVRSIETMLDTTLDLNRRMLLFSSLGFGLVRMSDAAPKMYDYFASGAAFATAATPAPGTHGTTLKRGLTPLNELRADADKTVLAIFSRNRARILSSAAANSTAWTSPFTAYLPAIAPMVDIKLLLRTKLLIDPIFPQCACGYIDAGDNEALGHALTCNRVLAPNATYRHNCILATLAYALQRTGLVIATEPRFYAYDDGHFKRPDLTAFGHPGLATDVTIAIDTAAAAVAKSEKHAAAAANRNHAFIPFVISTWGDMHGSVDQFLREALKGTNTFSRKIAFLETKRAVAEAWAIGTAAVINGALNRHVADARHNDIASFFMA